MRLSSMLVFLLLSSSAFAADDEQARYDRCMQQSVRDPQAAYTTANSWPGAKVSLAAEHCMASALVGLKRYKDGAAMLDALARRPDISDIGTRSEILSQAGNAWLLGGDAKKADASFSFALTLNPRNADAFADVARAKAALKDWKGAESHLTAAIGIDPRRADLYVLRASSRHALEKKIEARADLERALDLRPGMPEALLQRGGLKQEAGDLAGARADWEAVVVRSTDAEMAQTARALLSGLP